MKGLAVALEFLSLNDFELVADNVLFENAVRDIVTGDLTGLEFADLLYAQYAQEQL